MAKIKPVKILILRLYDDVNLQKFTGDFECFMEMYPTLPYSIAEVRKNKTEALLAKAVDNQYILSDEDDLDETVQENTGENDESE